jgi:hypothetical protein
MECYPHATLSDIKKSTNIQIKLVAYNGTVNFVKRNGSEREGG